MSMSPPHELDLPSQAITDPTAHTAHVAQGFR